MNSLTWSLALATYERLDVLVDCIDCVLSQTYPPIEIVVVDGSKDWLANKEVISNKVSGIEGIRFEYLEAEIKSAAAQRNQAASRCTGDVLFLIDDDTLMYPNCAQEIMQLYELDVEGKISAVAGSNVSLSPLQNAQEEVQLLSSSPGGGQIKQWIRKVLNANNRFVPYDDDFPCYEIPGGVSKENIAVCKTLPGFSLTMRRKIVIEEKFESRLKRYSADEDSDLTYRASRRGPLIKALNAHLHHIGSPGGRLSVFSTTALTSINIVYLHRLHSSNLKRSKTRLRAFLFNRLAVEFAKDIYYRGFRFPRARGILVGIVNLDRVLFGDEVLFEKLQIRLTNTVPNK